MRPLSENSTEDGGGRRDADLPVHVSPELRFESRRVKIIESRAEVFRKRCAISPKLLTFPSTLSPPAAPAHITTPFECRTSMYTMLTARPHSVFFTAARRWAGLGKGGFGWRGRRSPGTWMPEIGGVVGCGEPAAGDPRALFVPLKRMARTLRELAQVMEATFPIDTKTLHP